MIEKIRKVSNPLTIIAIFAALAELSGTVALGLVSEQLQSQFIWFVMLFPVLLVLLFFVTLNFNPRVFYSPSDFSDESNFMFLNKVTEQAERSYEEILKSIEQDETELNARLSDSKSLDKYIARNARGNVKLQNDRMLSIAEAAKRRLKDHEIMKMNVSSDDPEDEGK